MGFPYQEIGMENSVSAGRQANTALPLLLFPLVLFLKDTDNGQKTTDHFYSSPRYA